MQNILLIVFSLIWVTSYSQFGTQNIISTQAKNPVSIFSIDIDGDGNLDVLSASSNTKNIAWYKNMDGQGNFGPLNLIGLLDEAESVNAANLDGDGDMDVIATSSYLDKVVWYENLDGQGNFSAQKVISSNADGAFCVIAADLDGDGDNDIISASDNSGLAWYENLDGNGTFSTTIIIDNLILNSRSVVAADMDGDGDLDLVGNGNGPGNGKIFWYENLDGLGTFGLRRVINDLGSYANVVFVADADEDGDMDVFSAVPVNNEIAWHENMDGLGNFGPKRSITTSAVFVLCVFVADLDNDGDMDILAESSGDPQSGQVMWYENLDGLGNFGPEKIITTEVKAPHAVIAADLDDDSDMDVVSTSLVDDKIAWYENQTIIGIEENQLNSIKVYPNPTKSFVFIDSKTENILSATVFDLLGKKVVHLDGNIQEVDVSNLQSGMYFLKLTTDIGEQVRKIIKE